jgi:hypothetical protein
VTLHQPSRRERILIYGSFKTGKSFNWLDIARAHHTAGNKGKFYVIDTDFGAHKLLSEGYDYLEDEGVIKIYNPLDFRDILDASKDIYRSAKRGDWIVIDMLNYFWEEAQEFYIRNVFGEDPENYFLQMRQEVVAKKGKDSRSFGGQEGTDWGFITKIYKQAEFPLTMKSAANVLSITEERKIDPDRGDSAEKVKQFKGVGGMAPTGQKGIGHRHDTVLRMSKRANGQRQLTRAGDKGHEGPQSEWAKRGSNILNIEDYEPDAKNPKGFTRRYLIDIAGWTDTNKKAKKPSESKPRSSTGKAKGGGRRRK